MNPIHDRYFPGGATVNPLENFSQEHVVKLHDAVDAQELGIGVFKGQHVIVNSSTMEHLNLAQETLRKAKMLMPYGAGNQKVDMFYTGGESFMRLHMQRHRSLHPAPIPNAQQVARYQAGNCGETSDISYTLLAQQRINAPVLLVRDNDWDHRYVLIGDPRDQTWGERNTVVVDPWVSYPSAVTLAQAIRRNPRPQPDYQRACNAAPLPAAQALDSISHVSTAEIMQYMVEIDFPPIGNDFLEWLSESKNESNLLDEKIVAEDPSTRYSTNMLDARSTDDIAQATVSRQRAAQQAWDNSPYRW
ncbi:type III effector [Brenneria rubrifaciens]|uniref:Type III effector n=1 Tax=Brenneria rubrifaciens TaxID=55213 RepID=A0A4P8QNF4_9GAMM|nr:type III effector [Brenneria rubrifaciens]QCR07866.1 type III effector [Brenneria rubrifaciens]